MYRATEVPEAFGVRVKKGMTCKISLPDSLEGAAGARLLPVLMVEFTNKP